MRLLLLIAAFTFSFQSFAKEKGYGIGDTVATFSLKNVDGKMVSPDDYKNARGFIIVFTCNHCPFAKLYQDRLNALNGKYVQAGVSLLAISSNDATAVPDDSYKNMVRRAKEKQYTYPYLYDHTQEVAKAFGAIKTPQAYVIFKENGQWILKYYGAIDDNGAEPDKVKNHFVEDAVIALLKGESVATTNTKSVGCSIKWK
jgi:peroxiredoxin